MGLFDARDRAVAEQLYSCAKVLGQVFLAFAIKNGIVSKHDRILALTLHAPDAALALGYIVVTSAYRLRPHWRKGAVSIHREWFREVLARQELAKHRRMHADFLRVMADKLDKPLPYLPPNPSEAAPMRNLVRIHFDKAEETIAKIVTAFQADEPRPLGAAYGGLVGYFGGKGDDAELDERYSAILTHLMVEARKAVATL